MINVLFHKIDICSDMLRNPAIYLSQGARRTNQRHSGFTLDWTPAFHCHAKVNLSPYQRLVNATCLRQQDREYVVQYVKAIVI